MKLKLPFYNPKNYVLFRFVTCSPFALEHAVPTLTLKAKHDVFSERSSCPRERLKRSVDASFKTCFGLTESYRRSITFPNWCDFLVDVEDGELNILTSAKGGIKPLVTKHDDHDYQMQKGMVMVKFTSFWSVETEGDTDSTMCVTGAHILNTTPMMIPTAVIDFKHPQHDINIFNKIDTSYDHNYKIPFGHPLVSLFPLTTKEIRVETEYDHEKYHSLGAGNMYASHFKGTMVKYRQKEQLSKKT